MYNDLAMTPYKKNWLKFALGILGCLLVRLLPFRAPNIEPIMSTAMPFGKAYGASAGFFFAFFSIILYDLATGTLGKWTMLTSVSYGVVGYASAYYFKNREPSRKNFVYFAILGTLFFDAFTGLLTGPLFFDQPILVALVGQIPFTILHLVGNVSFAFILSPVIYSYLVKKKKLYTVPLIKTLQPKTI